MSQNLCISVTFLDPFFHAKGDGNQPEWPPAPMRLFQALLAGSRTGYRGKQWTEERADAFSWLAAQDPPYIVAPKVHLASHYRFFVPNNDGDKKLHRQERLTSKLATAQIITGDAATVFFIWPIKDNMGHKHAHILCNEARNMLALGWGMDQVVGNGHVFNNKQVDSLVGEPWHFWPHRQADEQTWRVPAPGSLEDLEHVYQSFLQRIDLSGVGSPTFTPSQKVTCFRTITYLRGHARPARPYTVFELPDGVAFCHEQVTTVARMLRSAACHCAKRDTHEFPGGSGVYVAGHIDSGNNAHTPPRFSYLPLPSIGHPHSDGMIRRLLIAESFEGDGSHAYWARNRLRNLPLVDQDGNQRGLLLELWRATSHKVVQKYIGKATAWATVTPIILSGFDDGKQRKAEKLLLQAIEQAGLNVDMVADLALRKAPFWPQSAHPLQYSRPKYLKNLPAWHASITFHEPLAGPLALGAGRHCGLGILAIVDAAS